ncbi:hypothetical protein [Acinetobacter bereziniae]|nr:hypothetical protein [Acinetobacter bereziniae]
MVEATITALATIAFPEERLPRTFEVSEIAHHVPNDSFQTTLYVLFIDNYRKFLE